MTRWLLILPLIVVAAFIFIIPTPFSNVLPIIRLSRSSAGSGGPAVRPLSSEARDLLLITIDTLRADHVGAYGGTAHTPALDRLAAHGVRFVRAYAAAPITLTSHASLLTGRYPPAHRGRHNGIAISGDVPTLATVLKARGFQTAAFVSAFPLDRRFGLNRGFDVYDDQMPRDSDGHLLNERAGAVTIDRTIAWLRSHKSGRRFVWVHLFEPHAPYGQPVGAARPAVERYDDEIGIADQEIGRLLRTWGSLEHTLVVATGDHGEAFGEHGEIGHSIFVYDTTLRVPLIMAGAIQARSATVIDDPVTLVDLAPTVTSLLDAGSLDSDGVDLRPTWNGQHVLGRALYAESFGPLLDFGWSPLRSLRRDGVKLIAAPRPELYDVHADPEERNNVIDARLEIAGDLLARVERISGTELPSQSGSGLDRETSSRLRALGYASLGRSTRSGARPDPKDRIAVASRIASVTSGELQGAAAEAALAEVLRQDAANPQAHLRLGVLLAADGRCRDAESHFAAAIAGGLPSADPHLGLAACQRARGDNGEAMKTLVASRRVESNNPVVEANIGLIHFDVGRVQASISTLTRALEIDPDLHLARFTLARALARVGRRDDALRQATELLARLSPAAPQRGEVERLVAALR
jgi:choline-sulfatase